MLLNLSSNFGLHFKKDRTIGKIPVLVRIRTRDHENQSPIVLHHQRLLPDDLFLDNPEMGLTGSDRLQQRHRTDRQVNNRKSHVLRKGQLVEEKWHRVQVSGSLQLFGNT